MAKDDNAHPEDAPPRRGRGVKILLIATRPTDAPLTGRKAVLRTIVRSCEALGHAVDIAVIGPAGANPRFTSVPAPGILTVLGNVVRHFVFGRKSLNECLYWSPKAQRQIARLVAAGASNPEIAQQLFLSRKTIERHVSNILRKVGARNRAELAGRVAELEIEGLHR